MFLSCEGLARASWPREVRADLNTAALAYSVLGFA
jgi:hypothetical protein